jgi:hypothetical protein
MEKKDLEVSFIVLCMCSIAVSILVRVPFGEAYEDLKQSYYNLDFSSSMKGASYEVTLTNEDDPTKICLIDGRTDDLLILAPDYFYITQGNQLIHGVAVHNSWFEIHRELSGCWNIMREKDSLQVRLINLSESDIFFRTVNSELETLYAEKYEQISGHLLNSAIILSLIIGLVSLLLIHMLLEEL